MSNDKEIGKYQLFQTEDKILADAQRLLNHNHISVQEMKKAYKLLTVRYETLLEEVKIHTKVGDKLQAKLYSINEELELAKDDLEKIVEERTAELKQANIDLLAINEELDSFVYRAAHDIRGPLATLLGLCNLAKMDIDESKALAYFEMLQATAMRLDNILSRLMIINKLKNQLVNIEHITIQETVNAVIEEYAHKKELFVGVRFRIDIEKNFGFDTDKSILEIMLYNILENAANTLTTPMNERISPEIINIKVVPQSIYFEIFITHKGFCIPLEVSDQIFNMFYRPSEKSEVTGLKLYTAKRAAEKLKGRIWLVESNAERTTIGMAVPYSYH
jgi:signal transduction histidine kinase